MEIVLILVIFSVAGFAFFLYRKNQNLKSKLFQYDEKYSKIINIDVEVEKSNTEKNKILAEISNLRLDYQEKYVKFKALQAKIAIYDEDIELAEMGFYKPHFEFNTSEIYKEQIYQIREQQKSMLKAKTAVICRTEWTVGDSKAEGKKMTNRGIRLTSRAFNNECEASIANVRWNNAIKMQERISKAYDDINKLNESNHIIIDAHYLKLKLNELWLAYEYQEKLKQEKEEQAEIRRQMREEAKLEQEILAAQKEEERYQKLLLKAQSEASKAVGENLEKLNAEILVLSNKLEEAHLKNERAISMAQQTRAGHVYVISNLGSFGENVYKIGMTRRLEPLDRVSELGDASVPFYFDVHAMIYSDDAPSMENALHRVFAEKRLNLVNLRKEFFNVSLDDIKNEVHKICPNADFMLTAEAEEYRESMHIRHEKSKIELIQTQEIPAVI